MPNLFEKKPVVEDDYERLAREDLENRSLDRDLGLVEEGKARLETLIDLNKELIQPTRMLNSEYHQALTRDLKISNIGANEFEFIRAWLSLIDHLLFIGLEDAAKVMHAELLGFLAAKSSVDGFEREALISTIARILKGSEQQPQQRKLF